MHVVWWGRPCVDGLVWRQTDARQVSRGAADANDPASPERQLVNALLQLAPGDPAAATTITPPPAPTGQALGLAQAEIEAKLLAGDAAGAVDHAVAARLWPHALLIASRGDAAMLRRVVEAFTESSLHPASPLRTAYCQFVGNAERASGGGGAAMVGNWGKNLAMLLANRMAGDARTLVALGALLVPRLHTCARGRVLTADPTSLGVVGREHVRVSVCLSLCDCVCGCVVVRRPPVDGAWVGVGCAQLLPHCAVPTRCAVSWCSLRVGWGRSPAVF